MVEVNTDGRDLEKVCAQLKDAEAELAALRAVPTPCADIEERVKGYVQEMARLRSAASAMARGCVSVGQAPDGTAMARANIAPTSCR